MKKITSALTAALVAASALSAVPFTAAAEDYVYGTMNIPYADFYKAEFGEAPNAYEVDAVSSATTGKWTKNGEGELFEGTYHSEPAEDGTGQILGVTYPVAITQADLDALGENNYGFTALEAAPEAYKIVTVADGAASFSAVQDAAPQTITADVVLSTETPWGDYLMEFQNTPEGFNTLYRGAIVKTAGGKAFAMRHEQNIWRGELAWSSGFKTEEPHGNKLDFENYVELMGETVNEVVFIGLDGYTTLATETYIPVKCNGTVKVDNAPVSAGKTTFLTDGFPADYKEVTNVGEGFTVDIAEITYTGVQPGNYTLTVSDENGKYADVSASFTLTTADIPVVYEDGRLVPAKDFTEADAANFIKNIAKVTVGEKDYNTGRRGTTIVKEDGTIDFAAASRDGNVFDGSGNYSITVTSTGYDNAYSFEVKAAAETTTAPAETTTTTTTTTAAAAKSNTSTTAARSNSSSSNSNSASTTAASSTSSPKTGDSTALPLAAAAVAAGAAALAFSRRRK